MGCDEVDLEHTTNVLGALALALTDRVDVAVAAVADLSPSDAAALSTLHHMLLGPSVEQLRRVLGLTHSGTVRLVDRLARTDLVARTQGPDARTVTVALTETGRDRSARASEVRAHTISEALARLTPGDRVDLDRLAGQVLVALMRGPGATRWICRRCDTGACGRYADTCPIGREVQRRQQELQNGD